MRTFALLLGVAIASASAVPAIAADPAQQRIEVYHQAVIAVAKVGGTAKVRAARFEPVVRTYYAMPVITALVVGPAWTRANAADRAAAITALTRHSAVQLAGNFSNYGGERYVTDPAVVARGADKLVRATLGGTAVVYRLRDIGGRWAIVDVLSGGISQLAVQRSDFAAAVASGGAAGLAKRLAEMDAKAVGGK